MLIVFGKWESWMSLTDYLPPRRRITLTESGVTTEDDSMPAPDVSRLMLRVFGEKPEDVALTQENAPRKFEVAFDVLKRGAEALDDLQHRSEELRAEIEAITERSRADLEAAERQTREWQQLATVMKAKYEDAQSQIGELEARVEAAEQEIEDVEHRAAQSEQRAVKMERLATDLHDEIMSAFGSYSAERAALDSRELN